MNRSKLTTIGVIGCLSIILMSCDLSETVVPDTDSSKNSTIQEDSADYVWNESDVIPITLADKASAIAGTLSNGLYTGGTYSNGTLKKSVTLSASSTVNTVSI